MKNTYSEQPDGRHNAPIICRCEGAEHTAHIAGLFDSAAGDLSGRHISSRWMMCGEPVGCGQGVRTAGQRTSRKLHGCGETQQCSIGWRLTLDLLSPQFDSNSDGFSMVMRSHKTWKVSWPSGNLRISLK